MVTPIYSYQKYETLYTLETYFDPKPTMTPHPYQRRPDVPRDQHTTTASIRGSLLFALVVMGLFVAISYPVYAVAVVGTVAAAAALFRLGAPRLARRLHGRMTELAVPGIGTVQIRVNGR